MFYGSFWLQIGLGKFGTGMVLLSFMARFDSFSYLIWKLRREYWC